MPKTRRRDRRRPRALVMALVMLVVATALLGGCTSAGEPERPRSVDSLVSVDRFASQIRDPSTFALNVHTPDEGSLAGTDAEIPYDELRARADELPADRSTTVAVYCMTGRMSADAVRTLTDLGYTRLVELRGGMRAWMREGRRVQPPSG